jgi:hypothetical protein
MRTQLETRLIAAGLRSLSHEEVTSRMNTILQELNNKPEEAGGPHPATQILSKREFHISPVREKSIGSLIIKAMHYMENKAFRDIYVANKGKDPDLEDIDTWEYMLCNIPDAHAFRVVLSSEDAKEEVQNFLINGAFGALSDIGIEASSFIDPRDEHFIDDKSRIPDSSVNFVNMVFRKGLKGSGEEAGSNCAGNLAYEIQLLTGREYFNYRYGLGNHVGYKQAKGNGNGGGTTRLTPYDVLRTASAVKRD